MKGKRDYLTDCLAMQIVNKTNETNGVDVDTRQANNDECFDYAYEKIAEFVKLGDFRKLKTALHIFLYNLMDTGDLEVGDDIDSFIDCMTDYMSKDDEVCVFKNFDIAKVCEFDKTDCKCRWNTDCGKSVKETYEHLIELQHRENTQ